MARVKISGMPLAKANRILRRRWLRRRKMRPLMPKHPKGYLKIIRKLPEIALYNSAVGSAAVVDPTGSCLSTTVLGLSTGATANLYDVAFSLKFRLDQVINSADLTTIADKYKIKGAYVRVYFNNSNSSTTTLGGMPFIQYVTDGDDAAVPTSVNQLREKMGVNFKTFKNASTYIGMKVIPKPNREIYATGVFTGYEPVSRPIWIDCNSVAVEHYGIKGILSQLPLQAPATTQSIVKFDVALVVELKDFQ